MASLGEIIGSLLQAAGSGAQHYGQNLVQYEQYQDENKEASAVKRMQLALQEREMDRQFQQDQTNAIVREQETANRRLENQKLTQELNNLIIEGAMSKGERQAWELKKIQEQANAQTQARLQLLREANRMGVTTSGAKADRTGRNVNGLTPSESIAVTKAAEARAAKEQANVIAESGFGDAAFKDPATFDAVFGDIVDTSGVGSARDKYNALGSPSFVDSLVADPKFIGGYFAESSPQAAPQSTGQTDLTADGFPVAFEEWASKTITDWANIPPEKRKAIFQEYLKLVPQGVVNANGR